MSTRVYEDFFDDNAGQLQTSLKGLSDELDSPMDYDYRMIIRDDNIDIRDEKWIERRKIRLTALFNQRSSNSAVYTDVVRLKI